MNVLWQQIAAIVTVVAAAVWASPRAQSSPTGNHRDPVLLICATYAEDDLSRDEARDLLEAWTFQVNQGPSVLRAAALCRLYEMGGKSPQVPGPPLLTAALDDDPECLPAHYHRGLGILACLRSELVDLATDSNALRTALMQWAEADRGNALPWYLLAAWEYDRDLPGEALASIERGNEEGKMRSWPVWWWLKSLSAGEDEVMPCASRGQNHHAFVDAVLMTSRVNTILRHVGRQSIDLANNAPSEALRARYIRGVWGMGRVVAFAEPQHAVSFLTGMAIGWLVFQEFPKETLQEVLGDGLEVLDAEAAAMRAHRKELVEWIEGTRIAAPWEEMMMIRAFEERFLRGTYPEPPASGDSPP